MLSFKIVLLAMMLAVIGYALWGRRQAGSVLLKVGRSRTNKLFLGFGVLMILLSASYLLDTPPVLDEGFFSGLLAGIFFILFGWSGLEIRKAGIFSDGQLLKWERIESYEWGEKTLLVWMKRRWYSRRTAQYRVPPHQKQAVNDLLAQHVSGASARVEVV